MLILEHESLSSVEDCVTMLSEELSRLVVMPDGAPTSIRKWILIVWVYTTVAQEWVLEHWLNRGSNT